MVHNFTRPPRRREGRRTQSGAVLAGAFVYCVGSRVVGHRVSVDALIVVALMFVFVFFGTWLIEHRRAGRAGK
jgi:hypothetical protein